MPGRLAFALLSLSTLLLSSAGAATASPDAPLVPAPISSRAAECAETRAGDPRLVSSLDDDEQAPHAGGREPQNPLILPCALADLSEMASGPACADATFYVVSTTGVLLCQIDAPIWAPGTMPSLERVHGLAHTAPPFAATGLGGESGRLVGPFVSGVLAPPEAQGGTRREGFHRRPAVPS